MKKISFNSFLHNVSDGIHGGTGPCFGGRVLDHGQLGDGSWCFVDLWRIPAGTSIGSHRHYNGREMYYLIKGEATMTCNGEKIMVREGDLWINEPGDEHGFANDSGDDVHLLVTMVLDGDEDIMTEDVTGSGKL